MSAAATRRVQSVLSHLQAERQQPESHADWTIIPQLKAQPTAAKKKPVVVTVTGAAGNIAYSLLWMIGQGRLLGDDQPVELRLLDIPAMEKAVSGVIMELADSAFPIVSKLVGTSDYKTAFSGVDIALLVGAKPRGPGMQRKDLLSANGAIFAGQGKALNQWANRNVKVVVVGNPANTNALIAAENAPDLPKSAFTAMTRLDQNRAQAQIAARLSVPVSSVKNVIIWGNHSKTQYPDVNHAVIANALGPASVSPLRAAVNDSQWLDGDFISTVQDRGAAIIAARSKSSAASAASACVDHVHDWWLGTKPGEMVSMAVYSDGSAYGVPAGLVFSFPCQCRGGKWEVVKGLKIDSESQKRLDITTKELQEEKKEGLGH